MPAHTMQLDPAQRKAEATLDWPEIRQPHVCIPLSRLNLKPQGLNAPGELKMQLLHLNRMAGALVRQMSCAFGK